MRKTIIAGNWKMHTDAGGAQNLARKIVQHVGDKTEPAVLVCPPAPLLTVVNSVITGSSVLLGGQNVHAEPYGAFTGEMSDTMLASVGCSFVIIGHSERRALFGEKDFFLNEKMRRVMAGPLTPVLCIGETLKEREAGQTMNRIEQQLSDDLKGITVKNGHDLVVAYEPVWAIGTGRTATPDQAEEVHAFIRERLDKMFGWKTADDISILYGGSVKPDNARDLLSKPDIDGALVGGASLKAESFGAIIDAAR